MIAGTKAPVTKSMTKSLVYLRPLRVACVRAVGPYETSVPQAWTAMETWLAGQGLLAARGSRYGLLRDNPNNVADAACRYDACVALEPNIDERFARDIDIMTLPGGPYARLRHVGSADALIQSAGNVYSSFTPQAGLQIDERRPLVTIYLGQARDQSALRADVCVPLTSAATRVRLGQAA